MYNRSCSKEKEKLHSQTFYVLGFYINIKMLASALMWTVWEVQVYQKSDYFNGFTNFKKKTQNPMWNDRKHDHIILI